MLEGIARIEGGRTTRLRTQDMSRLEYAHPLRKGGHEQQRVHAFEALARVRTALPNADTLCPGMTAGYRLDQRHVAMLLGAGFCTSTTEHLRFDSRTNELDLSLRLMHAWDLSARMSLEAGGGAALAYFTQRFDTTRRAPTRRTVAPYGELAVGLTLELRKRTYLTWDAALQTYLLMMGGELTAERTLRTALCARMGLGVGSRF